MKTKIIKEALLACILLTFFIFLFSCKSNERLYQVKKVIIKQKGKYFTFTPLKNSCCPKSGDTGYIVVSVIKKY